jgi:membrane associated rhomboid family serine protease
MMGYERSDDNQPLMWFRGYPIHATLMLVILHSVALIVCCVLPPDGFWSFGPLLGFWTDAAWHGKLWQFFTYGFCHAPSPWFLVDMFFLFMWGREVERYFGRKTFLLLYGSLWAAGPILLSAYRAVTRNDNTSLVGSYFIDLGVFIAFVTIYPNVQFFFGILAKWVAFAFLALGTLEFVRDRQFDYLLILWGSVAVAFFGTRYASTGASGFNVLGSWRDQFPQRAVPSGVKPRIKPRRALDTRAEPTGDVHDSIDPLLEKISRHGLASLTHGERATLEKARASLLRKERGT